MLNLSVSSIHTLYTRKERTLKAARIIIGSGRSKVIYFSHHTIMDKMESLSPEGTDGYTKPVVLLSYLTLKKKSVIAFNK